MKRAEYGGQVVAHLAVELTGHFGRGFGPVNPSHVKRFYLLWPEKEAFQIGSEISALTATAPHLDLLPRVAANHAASDRLLDAGRFEEAVDALARAVRAGARVAGYRWLHAQALLASGRGEDALRALEQAARLPGPHRAQARDLAGRVREQLEATRSHP